jgi:hypothetical protein
MVSEEARLESSAALQAMKESGLGGAGSVGRHVLGQQDVESDATIGGTLLLFVCLCLGVCVCCDMMWSSLCGVVLCDVS